jgi:hypothetical protein
VQEDSFQDQRSVWHRHQCWRQRCCSITWNRTGGRHCSWSWHCRRCCFHSSCLPLWALTICMPP